VKPAELSGTKARISERKKLMKQKIEQKHRRCIEV
jgi:hypothetical protein